MVFSSPDQKIIDRRDDWWAVKAGLVKAMPAVQRIVYLPFPGETQTAQAHITNAIDSSLDMRPNTIKQILAQNPKIQGWNGSDPPYGYTDWWPTSLYVDTTKAPWTDKDMRWALSYFDRSPAADRRRLQRRQHHDPAAPPGCGVLRRPEAVLGRGQTAARSVQHQRVQPGQGGRQADRPRATPRAATASGRTRAAT